jgi:predicted enzyme related to lactoylglutathione lyase
MQGVSHVAIGVSEMDRSLPFYRDVLGDRDPRGRGGCRRSADAVP